MAKSNVTIKQIEENMFSIKVENNEFEEFEVGDYIYIKKSEYEITQKITNCLVYARKTK